jgi:hypothetical protein
MVTKIIVEELKLIKQLLDENVHQMEKILSSKARNVMWRLFFPAGQFIQQKSLARDASLGLLNLDTRLRVMEEVLEERQHPLRPQISEILEMDLITMSKKLVQLPERAQYMIGQIESIKQIIDQNIQNLA